MTSQKCYSLLANSLPIILLALFHFSQAVLAAPQLSGSYKIVATQDLGSTVRVTLDLHVGNQGPDRLYLTQLAVGNPLRPVPSVGSGPAVIIEPEATCEFTKEFTVDKAEYESWLQGSRPRLSIALQSSSGTQATITISLLRRLR